MKFEYKYYVGVFVVALLIGIINNIRLENSLDWFASPKILEKPPELKESK